MFPRKTIKEATLFAQWAHHGQMYGENEYIAHLEAVHDILYGFLPVDEPNRDEQLIAAILHDTVEDTGVTNPMIRTFFGDYVAQLVWRVTNEYGKNRAERHARTLPKIRQGGVPSIRLKLADRIANMESSVGKKIGQMYVGEYPAFRKELWSDVPELETMWFRADYVHRRLALEGSV